MFDRFSAGSPARRNLVWAAVILLVVGAGYWWYRGGDSARSSAKGPPGGMTPPVPVKVETAKVQDLDIFLRGLGTRLVLEDARSNKDKQFVVAF